MGGLACTLFELSWYLMGMDKVLEDMVGNKDFLHAYLDRLLTWVMDAGAILTGYCVDVLWIGDDVGAQDRLLISPEMFRVFLKPRYIKLFSHLKCINPDLKFAFHTDGYVIPIMKDLIEAGVNILNPVQPQSMDTARLRKDFGKELTFWGTIDNQGTMPFGTVEDVINEIKLRLKTVAPGGGLILGPAHNVQPQVPVEIIMAFYDKVKKFGNYPINL